MRSGYTVSSEPQQFAACLHLRFSSGVPSGNVEHITRGHVEPRPIRWLSVVASTQGGGAWPVCGVFSAASREARAVEF